MVNGELMELIAVYSLHVVMRAKRFFNWIDDFKDTPLF